MSYLIFAMSAFLVLFLIDVATSTQVVEPTDANGMPGDFPTKEDLEFMELITEPQELGEA